MHDWPNWPLRPATARVSMAPLPAAEHDMSLSIQQVSIGTFTHMLGVLDRLLSKGEAHAAARGVDPATLIATRLAPDMHDLPRQVQIACDMAKGAAARLSGVEVPKHDDTETTFAELHARIAKVRAFLSTIDPAALEAGADRTITITARDRELTFAGRDYLVGFVLPNFYFHVTIAYALLRHAGVELGKLDFLSRS
jgi:uncharacterized protein